MRYLLLLLSIIFIVACNPHGSDNKTNSDDDTLHTGNARKDSVAKRSPTGVSQDSFSTNAKEELLMQLSEKVLKSLKTKNLAELVSFIHPTAGIRFSPYGYIDTINGRTVSAAKLITLGKEQTPVKWGLYDGSGETITLSIDKYFERFVYSKDFLNAEKRTINKSNKTGNSLDNLKEIYPDADYTEFYFPGFDPKFEGMDWQKLRLIFRTENNRPWLIAIVHDEWTI
jgi:hypothetical protein